MPELVLCDSPIVLHLKHVWIQCGSGFSILDLFMIEMFLKNLFFFLFFTCED